MARERLDKVLVERGLAASRERARALILAGKVTVNGQPVDKAGAQVGPEADVQLREEDHPYVSRGALKLIKALDDFGVSPEGLVCMDVGASTGGFTQVLLERGARKVYAIDVGYGQLAWSLRSDPRVVVMERQNIRSLDTQLLPEPAELAVVDVSFISLDKVLPRIAELLGPGRPIIVLVKPQFEVGRQDVGKGGVVRDEQKRRAAVDGVASWAREAGFQVGGEAESPILGPAGNVEYLMHLTTPGREP